MSFPDCWICGGHAWEKTNMVPSTSDLRKARKRKTNPPEKVQRLRCKICLPITTAVSPKQLYEIKLATKKRYFNTSW